MHTRNIDIFFRVVFIVVYIFGTIYRS